MGSFPWCVCCAAPISKSTRQPRPPSVTCPLKATIPRRRYIAAAASQRLWLCSEIQTLQRYRNSWQVQVMQICNSIHAVCVHTHTYPCKQVRQRATYVQLILFRVCCQSLSYSWALSFNQVFWSIWSMLPKSLRYCSCDEAKCWFRWKCVKCLNYGCTLLNITNIWKINF